MAFKDLNLRVKIWFFLHSLAVISVILGFVLSFKNPFYLRLPLITGTILHLYIAYIELIANPPAGSPAQNAGQPFPNRVFLNYSVHIVGVNVFQYLMGIFSFSWSLVIGFSSFFQILNFLIYQIPSQNNSWIVQKMRFLHQKLTAQPLAQHLLAMMEIMCLMPTPSVTTRGKAGLVHSLISTMFYLFWHVLYRYAMDGVHRQIWAQLRQQYATLAFKLPSFLSNLLMGIPHNLENFGNIGMKIYQVKKNN